MEMLLGMGLTAVLAVTAAAIAWDTWREVRRIWGER